MRGWNDKNGTQGKELLNKNDLKLAAMSGDGTYFMCYPANKEVYLEYMKGVCIRMIHPVHTPTNKNNYAAAFLILFDIHRSYLNVME